MESRPSNNEISVPILTWSTNFTQNNLRIWKEQMANYAMNKYGYLGLLFQNNEYYVPDEIEYPSELDDGSDPLSDVNDPGGFLADDYKSQIRSRREHIKKMEMDRLPLYAFMYSKLSPQSKTALMREDTWNEIDQSKDVLALWLSIQATHLGGNGGVGGTRVVPGETARLLYKNLEDTKMYENEELSTYLRRFQIAQECYSGAELDAPEEATLAAIFIDNLNDSRFRQFKNRMINDFHQSGADYPSTISDSFQRASNWELDNPVFHRPRHSIVTNSSFHAAQQLSTQPNRNHRGRNPTRGRGFQNRKRNQERRSDTPLTCNLCGAEGHFLCACPHLNAAKEAIGKRSSEAKTNSFGVTITMSKAEDELSNPPESLNIAISLVTDAAILDDNSTALNPNEIVLEGDDFPGPWDILLDSQCQDHIFQNHSLLHGIHSADETMTFKGQVADASFSTRRAGYFLNFQRRIFFSPLARANLLSVKSSRRMAHQLRNRC
jgi:hypothetical protein